MPSGAKNEHLHQTANQRPYENRLNPFKKEATGSYLNQPFIHGELRGELGWAGLFNFGGVYHNELPDLVHLHHYPTTLTAARSHLNAAAEVYHLPTNYKKRCEFNGVMERGKNRVTRESSSVSGSNDSL